MKSPEAGFFIGGRLSYMGFTLELTNKEEELVEALVEYLYAVGKIKEPSLSEAVYYCTHFTAKEIVKAIERERYA